MTDFTYRRKMQNGADGGWQQRLWDAKLQLDLALHYLHKVQRDIDAGTVSSPDREYAYQCALRGEEVALKAYTEALDALRAALGGIDAESRADGAGSREQADT